MNLKAFFRKRVAKFLGVYPMQNELAAINRNLNERIKTLQENMNAIHALHSSKIPQSIKDDYFLQCFPTPGGGIKFSNAIDNIKAYLRLVRPVASANIRLRRFGGGYDGGYAMMIPPSCAHLRGVSLIDFMESNNTLIYKDTFPPPPPVSLSLDNDKKPLAVSLGVSPYSPWDLEMARLNYKVAQYDASIDKMPYIHDNIEFHRLFVGVPQDNGEMPPDTISLENVIAQNAMSECAHNILQCDIEDAEWAILERLDLRLLSRYFSQVLFEFHNCDPENEEFSRRRLAVLERLREFYTPIFTHFNHHDVTCYNGGLYLCGLIEVSYLRNDLLPSDCIPFSGYLNIKGLSAPNSQFYPDLPIYFED